MTVNILDGNYFISRYSHSPHNEHDYVPTSRLLSTMWEYRKYGDIVVVFDGRRPQFRLDLLPEYKQKPPQKTTEKQDDKKQESMRLVGLNIAAAKEVLRTMGIPVVQHPEYEADDQAYRLVQHFARFGEVNVMTSDSDWFQMTKIGASVIRPFHDEIVDRALFRERFGFPVEYYPLSLSLTGTHNAVPGIKSIGPVSARKIIMELDSPHLDSLKKWFSSEEELTGAKALVKKYFKTVKRNIKLVDMEKVPLTEFEMVQELEKAQLESKFNFKEFMKLSRGFNLQKPAKWVSWLGK